jgi:hypothetical protein
MREVRDSSLTNTKWMLGVKNFKRNLGLACTRKGHGRTRWEQPSLKKGHGVKEGGGLGMKRKATNWGVVEWRRNTYWKEIFLWIKLSVQ